MSKIKICFFGFDQKETELIKKFLRGEEDKLEIIWASGFVNDLFSGVEIVVVDSQEVSYFLELSEVAWESQWQLPRKVIIWHREEKSSRKGDFRWKILFGEESVVTIPASKGFNHLIEKILSNIPT